MNTLAWILATHPEAAKRDGAEAVHLAEAASKLLKDRDAEVLDTLAAAYAEVGRFDQAVAMIQKALNLLGKGDSTGLNRAMQERREIYRRHRPYREAHAGSGATQP